MFWSRTSTDKSVMLLLKIVLTHPPDDTHVGSLFLTYLGLRAKDLFLRVSKLARRPRREAVTFGRMRTASSDLLKCPLSFQVRAGDARGEDNLYGL